MGPSMNHRLDTSSESEAFLLGQFFYDCKLVEKETIAELEKRRQEIVDQLEEAKRTLALKESEKDETKQIGCLSSANICISVLKSILLNVPTR
ncbi:hypothetical protein Ddc_04695 [Ditylenchus destructor]|nr:hypothetical protein Ddc_04695 [Ditylenchus destructor]